MAGCATPTLPSLSRRGRGSHAGITLLEVMISIFVLAIGLLGTASLLPVASLQARRANIDDRKAAALQSATRDFKTRSFLRADYWVYDTAAPASTPVVSSSAPYNFINSSGSAITLPPVAIDPLMVASVGTASNAPLFASNGGTLVMPRITLMNVLGAAATQACMVQDDLAFKLSTTDQTALPTGGFNSNLTKRLYQGQFSWLATLVPTFGDVQASYSRNSMILSIVVFNQRRLQSAPVQGLSTDTERAATVASFGTSGTAYGGGDLTLSSTASTSAGLNLNIGEWLMLGWMVNDVPQSNGSYGGPRPYFRWYRIVSAPPATGSSGAWSRSVTVNGADINLNSMVSGSAMAFIYDGAVGVFERPVHLEGPSLWSN
jgi:type II secretory pathway pseudopilin PulG